MTNDQINVAIAKEIGWNPEQPLNFAECADDMHQAEVTLAGCLEEQYIEQLYHVWGKDHPGAFNAITAPAHARAEAFLRTLGKWEEAQP